jgi:hypothetical protein
MLKFSNTSNPSRHHHHTIIIIIIFFYPLLTFYHIISYHIISISRHVTSHYATQASTRPYNNFEHFPAQTTTTTTTTTRFDIYISTTNFYSHSVQQKFYFITTIRHSLHNIIIYNIF